MTLRWHPFQLRPNTPPQGMSLSDMLPAQYMESAQRQLEAATRAAGLPFKNPQWIPNTHLAHEAAMFAEERGKGDAFHRAVLRAHFAEQRNIGEVMVLKDIGAACGLDPAELGEALAQGTYRKAVDDAMTRAHQIGVTAVPAFVFGEQIGFAGAQPYEVFQEAMAAWRQAPKA